MKCWRIASRVFVTPTLFLWPAEIPMVDEETGADWRVRFWLFIGWGESRDQA